MDIFIWALLSYFSSRRTTIQFNLVREHFLDKINAMLHSIYLLIERKLHNIIHSAVEVDLAKKIFLTLKENKYFFQNTIRKKSQNQLH
jgi:hypothetical protein